MSAGTWLEERGAYVIAWSPFGWYLQSVETGAAFPNGRGMTGQHAKHFRDPESADRYAKRHRIKLADAETKRVPAGGSEAGESKGPSSASAEVSS